MSNPTGISASNAATGSGAATHYGASFDHTFTSADGNVASLENVPVGERFGGVPNPTAANHPGIAKPFGTFDFQSRTLDPDAPGGHSWFLTASGGLGSPDHVTIARGLINVAQFVASASHPSPAHALPQGFDLMQCLHWFCRPLAGMTGWQMPAFVQVTHRRELRLNGTGVEVVVSVRVAASSPIDSA